MKQLLRQRLVPCYKEIITYRERERDLFIFIILTFIFKLLRYEYDLCIFCVFYHCLALC